MWLYDRPHKITFHTLSEGPRGTLETASFMRELVNQYKVDPEIRGTAMSLVQALPDKDERSEVDAIFNFVRDGIRYLKDVWDVETLHSPPELLACGQGDCDDKSVLLAALLESIGYETLFKITGYDGPEFQHVYVIVRLNGVSIPLDPTEPEPAGWEAPGATAVMYVQ